MDSLPGRNIIRRMREEKGKPLIVAHRGFAPEDLERNTLPAFQYAIDLGADAIECDLRLTADGEVVIHHDPFIADWNRIRRISSSSLNELRKLVDHPTDLPTFSQVYSISEEIPLFLQIKDANQVQDILDHILKVVPEDKRERIIIMGYLTDIIDLSYTQFTWGKHYLIPSNRNIDIITQYPEHKSYLPIVAPYFRFLTDDHVHKLRKLGKDVVVFTVNNSRAIERYVSKSIAAIYTDKLDLAQKIVDTVKI